jgi:hypothetical protein
LAVFSILGWCPRGAVIGVVRVRVDTLAEGVFDETSPMANYGFTSHNLKFKSLPLMV